MRTIRIIAAAVAGTAAAATLALTSASAATQSGAAPAVAAGTTVIGVTTITGRDVSGNNGNWAKDDMNRTVRATLIGLHGGPERATLSPCYPYTGLVIDNFRSKAPFHT